MASEFFVVDQDNLVKLPQDMSYDEGAMIEPLAVSCHALSRIGSIEDKNIVVIGAGPIGNLTAQAAKALGAKVVMISDISSFRLSLAKKVGIDYTINPAEQNFSDQIQSAFGNAKADLMIECVGRNQTINDAIDNARKGTDILVVGVFGDKPAIDVGLVQNNELRLIGTLMYQRRDYLQAVDLVSSGKVQLSTLMTTHFPFQDYLKAYQFIEEHPERAMKVFIDVH
jgi:L-iditol 2-dehydrogenase